MPRLVIDLTGENAKEIHESFAAPEEVEYIRTTVHDRHHQREKEECDCQACGTIKGYAYLILYDEKGRHQCHTETFCSSCMLRWLQEQRRCPLCNRSATSYRKKKSIRISGIKQL